MRILIRILEIMPAILFGLIGLYYASRILVGYFPTEPLAWELFAKLTPVGREIGVLTWQIGLSSFVACALFTGLALVTGVIYQAKGNRRSQFFAAHLALLCVIFGAQDERVFTASLTFNPNDMVSMLPNFGALNLIHAILLVGIMYACTSVHRSIIWNLRYPYRTVHHS